MLLLLCSLAAAEGPEAFPYMAALDLPPTGASRIEVPLALRTGADPQDGSDLLLVDAEGTPVPFGIRHGHGAEEFVGGRRSISPSSDGLTWWPTAGPDRYEVRVGGRPIDALELSLPSSPLAATAIVRQDGEVVAEGLVYRVDAGTRSRLPLPAVQGVFELELRYWGAQGRVQPTIDGVRYLGPHLADERVELPVEGIHLLENGWARYDVLLPEPYPLEALELHPKDTLFDRAYTVTAPSESDAGLGVLPNALGSEHIRRLLVGGASIDEVRVPAPRGLQRRVAIFVDAQEGRPLTIDTVTGVVPASELVVMDPGGGPFTLYAGAPPGTRRPSDRQFAVPELARSAGAPVKVGPREANPAYLPPEVRSGTALPGNELDLTKSRWRHPVEGATGLVRVELSPEVLSTAKGDLSDLRLVDAAGREIPFLLRHQGLRRSWGELAYTRAEDGHFSILQVPIPQRDMVVADVTLYTDATHFERRVSVQRPRGAALETVRSYTWREGPVSSPLSLDLSERFGDSLVVRIDNGDNPPLPISRVEASWPRWELIALVPESGAELLYGDAKATRPRYDLALLEAELRTRVEAEATLGPRQAVRPPPLALVDRAILGFGVGVMGLGLLGLTLALLRQLWAKDEDEPHVGEATPRSEAADEATPPPT